MSDAAPLTLTQSETRRLRRAAALVVAADLMWIVQAGFAALAIAGWVTEPGPSAGWLLAGFAIAGLLRAAARSASEADATRLGRSVVERHQRAVIDLAAMRPDMVASSAEIAALVGDKIPLLAPYVARYRLGMVRVRIVPLVFVAVVAAQSWAAAVVLLVAGPLIPVFMALVGMAAKEASDRQMQEIGSLNRLLVDRIAALPDIRLLDGVARSRALFAARTDALRSRTMAVLQVAFLSSTVMELFSALGVAMVAVYVGFSLLGEIGFGTWGPPLGLAPGLFILLLVPDFFQPLRDLAAAWHDRAAAQSVATEIAALTDDPAPAILGRGAVSAPLPGPAGIGTAGVVARSRALPDLQVAPGEAVALAGPSGSGKSTLLDVLGGLLPAEAGTVTVAGAPLDHATADGWRARVAMVPQAVALPDTTLRSLLDPEGDGGGLAAALRTAGATDVVAALPDGLDTRLGETGAGVSGGEARRLLIARALHAQADVILADEPTADLDAESAARVIAALQAARARSATVVVATHDPALMAAMDRVHRIEGAA